MATNNVHCTSDEATHYHTTSRYAHKYIASSRTRTRLVELQHTLTPVRELQFPYNRSLALSKLPSTRSEPETVNRPSYRPNLFVNRTADIPFSAHPSQ